jgi:hypothetical protein
MTQSIPTRLQTIFYPLDRRVLARWLVSKFETGSVAGLAEKISKIAQKKGGNRQNSEA